MEKIFFDYSKLAGRIKEKFGSQRAFAEAMGITEATLSAKMNGYTYFNQAEIEKAVRLLDLETESTYGYFFSRKGIRNLNAQTRNKNLIKKFLLAFKVINKSERKKVKTWIKPTSLSAICKTLRKYSTTMDMQGGADEYPMPLNC